LSFELSLGASEDFGIPTKSAATFLDFLSDAVPAGDVFLFGGLLRDLALLGGRGFNSDVDVVIEGDWEFACAYIESIGASKNKFGGYRLQIADWPIDVWNAEETWAIKNKVVEYKGISSLTKTTVLNWDAILMNWRTKAFVFPKTYFDALHLGVLDIVLEQNPNPIGMATRVFRHLCAKNAAKITVKAAVYLARAAAEYPFEVLRATEIRSYGESLIEPNVYEFFKRLSVEDSDIEVRSRFGRTTEAMKLDLGLT
jgi:hypothetical protein